MLEYLGFIATVVALFATMIALIATVMALVASAYFYFKSSRQLQDVMNVLASYLELTIKDKDVKPQRNKKGDVIGLSITIRPHSANIQSQSDQVILSTDGPRKP